MLAYISLALMLLWGLVMFAFQFRSKEAPSWWWVWCLWLLATLDSIEAIG